MFNKEQQKSIQDEKCYRHDQEGRPPPSENNVNGSARHIDAHSKTNLSTRQNTLLVDKAMYSTTTTQEERHSSISIVIEHNDVKLPEPVLSENGYSTEQQRGQRERLICWK